MYCFALSMLCYLPQYIPGYFTFLSISLVILPSSVYPWLFYLPQYIPGYVTFLSISLVILPTSVYVTFLSISLVMLPSSVYPWLCYLPQYIPGYVTFLSISLVSVMFICQPVSNASYHMMSYIGFNATVLVIVPVLDLRVQNCIFSGAHVLTTSSSPPPPPASKQTNKDTHGDDP